MFNLQKIILITKPFLFPVIISSLLIFLLFLMSLLPDLGINSFVGRPSSFFSSNLEKLTSMIPIGFAFGAGMVSAVNPCGFVMLPAYLSLYLGSTPRKHTDFKIGKVFVRSIFIAGCVSIGFLVLFGVVGFLITAGSRSIVSIFPWIGFFIGILLILFGTWLLSGKTIYLSFLGKSANQIGDPSRIGFKGFFLFGISYGIVSLSCTLPIFLLVVGTTFASQGFLTAATQFISFALGMGFIVTVLTISVAFLNKTVVNFFIKIGQYINKIISISVILAGSYIVFYWLTIGGL